VTTDATPTLGDVLHDAITRRLSGVHTATAGRIESYDDASRTASVQPLVREAYKDEGGVQQFRRHPVVPSALVVFPRGYRATLVPGDLVMLVFASQPLDRVIASGGSGEVDPAALRRHSLTDAFAFPFEFADPAVGVEVTASEVRAGGAAPLALTSELAALQSSFSTLAAATTADLVTALKLIFSTWTIPGTQVTKGA
jgi:hypothetical protein